MPATVIRGLIGFLESELDQTVWDGEVFRQEPGTSTDVKLPGSDSIVQLEMLEDGFNRDDTTEDAYFDEGHILVTIFNTKRPPVETMLTTVEGLLLKSSNWPDINSLMNGGVGGPPWPYSVDKLLLLKWLCVQEKNLRGRLNKPLYRGELLFNVGINGGVISR